MYACVCHAVTDERVRACASADPRAGIRAIAAATRAGSGCGSCVGRLRALIEAGRPAASAAPVDARMAS